MSSDQHDPEVSRLGIASRRSFLTGTTALAAAAAVSACTSQGGGPQRSQVAPGGRIGRVRQVQVGGGRIFPEASVVVTQPTEGTYIGLSAICTHEECTLREVSDSRIFCGCHGSEFDLEGNVLKAPATEPLPKVDIKIDGEYFVLA